MDAIGISQLSGADDRGHIKITLRRGWWPDTDRLVSEAHMLQVTVCSGMHCHGLDAQFFARPQNTQCNFAAIGNQYFFKHGECPFWVTHPRFKK